MRKTVAARARREPLPEDPVGSWYYDLPPTWWRPTLRGVESVADAAAAMVAISRVGLCSIATFSVWRWKHPLN